MPARKNISSDDNEESENEGEPTLPPSKRAKTSSGKNDRGAHSATSAGDTRLRTISSKQAALNEERVATKNTKVETLRKQLLKAKKDAQKAQKEPSREADDNSCESEERDPEDDIGFHTSITKLPSIVPAGRKKTTTPVLRRTNLTAEQTALENPAKLSNRAFLTLDRRSSSPELRIQHAEDDNYLNQARTPSSPHMSPFSIEDHHDRPTSPSSGITSRQSSPSRTTSVAQTQTRKVVKSVAKFQQGVVIGKRPKAADYEEVVAALLVRAMFDYEGLVSTHDAFPDLSLRRQWTLQCWKQALKDTNEQIEISERMMTLVKKRGSRIRGHVVSCIRPQIIATYSFVRKTTSQAVARNRALYDKLIMKGAFHYKDPDTLSGFAQNKIISEILYLAWFEDKNSHGPVLSEYFNPIPLETLALIFTMIDFCLREWSTGTFLQAAFFEKDVLHTHKIYRVEVKAWSNINLAVTSNIRKKLFSRSLHNSGVGDKDAAIVSGLVGDAKDRVQTELDGRTGDTDSELSE